MAPEPATGPDAPWYQKFGLPNEGAIKAAETVRLRAVTGVRDHHREVCDDELASLRRSFSDWREARTPSQIVGLPRRGRPTRTEAELKVLVLLLCCWSVHRRRVRGSHVTFAGIQGGVPKEAPYSKAGYGHAGF